MLEGDSVIITRSLALALFDTDQAVGRRITDWEREYDHGMLQEWKVRKHFTVAGVVEDFRGKFNDRYNYNILIPEALSTNCSPTFLIRLKPDADADAFVAKMSEHQPGYMVGSQILHSLKTYSDYIDETLLDNDNQVIFGLMWTFIGLLLINVVIGTLGTFWLQIRKRTEDIGIMRSFGAKRRYIFGMLWKEAALLTFVATVIGQLIWLQFALNMGVVQAFTSCGTGHETNWVNTFWLHYLIVCVIQYLLLLAIVTIGMVVPTFLAMYKRPVEALQHE
jgi:ABC-type antimicrobial peptide transport system permease subunit